MVETSPKNSTSMFSPRKLALQVFGFLIGASLLGWCIYIAVTQGDWQRLLDANPWLVVGLLFCTVTSLFINACTFWITIRPVQRLKLSDLMWLNVGCNLLNYAPIRLGAIARIAYHMRFDSMNLLRIGAWFAMIMYVLGLTIGSCVLATLVHPRIDLTWAAMVVGQLLLFGSLTRIIVAHRLIARFGQGVDQMLSNHASLWGAMVFRMVDLTAYSGRMYCAMLILGLEFSLDEVLLLAIVAFMATLIPAGGQFGFREMAVTFMASHLASTGLDVTELGLSDDTGIFAQLAVIDSAGDALVRIPLGLIALVWLRKRWRTKNTTATE